MDEIIKQLSNYSSLTTKEKRNLSRQLEDLLEDDFEETKKIYIGFIDIF